MRGKQANESLPSDAEYLDLKLDCMFKQLFGHPRIKTITIAFLNDLLGRIGNFLFLKNTICMINMIKILKTDILEKEMSFVCR